MTSPSTRSHIRLLAAIVVLIVIAACACSSPNIAQAKSSLLDPGVLESIETQDGITTQKYSDGLTVTTSARQISEDNKDFEMSAEMPDDFGRFRCAPMVDSFIDELIGMVSMQTHEPNSSREQALLRYFSDYYIDMQEPDKAEPLAKSYLEMQIALEVKGEPLAYAQRTLGYAKVDLKKYSEALPLLKAATKFYATSKDLHARWQVLKYLARALTETGQSAEGLKCLNASKALASENHFVEPAAKTDYAPPTNPQRGITPTGGSMTVTR